MHGRAALPTSGGVEVWRCGGKCHLTAGTHWDDAAGVDVSEGHGRGALSVGRRRAEEARALATSELRQLVPVERPSNSHQAWCRFVVLQSCPCL